MGDENNSGRTASQHGAEIAEHGQRQSAPVQHRQCLGAEWTYHKPGELHIIVA